MLVYPSNLCSDVELCSWFGDTFRILCGVRQGSVLSPFVFSIYVDNVIDNLRISGYGLHIGNVFAAVLFLQTIYCYHVVVTVSNS